MKQIQILGVGCPRCEMLADHARQAAEELGLQFELVRVTDIDRILDFDVWMTPALAIDGQVKLVGKVATVEEIKPLLQ